MDITLGNILFVLFFSYYYFRASVLETLLTGVAAPSPRASLGRRTVCGRTEQRRPPVSKPHETKVRMVWGSFLIAAAALNTLARNGYNAQGVNLTFHCRLPSCSNGERLRTGRISSLGSCCCPMCVLTFTRYVFTPKLSCTSQSSCYCPLHLHCSHDCDTTARLMRNIRPPHRLPLCLPYTIQHWQWQYRANANMGACVCFSYYALTIHLFVVF